ncbi:hypothetical protein JCM21900_005750 [Sporobolomyces salmonicolor]
MVQELVPRLFQDEVARQAIERNVLVRADTGTGKTYVAILLMRRLAALPPSSSEHKLVIFLTPTVALVEQQAQAIAERTTLRVKRFIGADGVDYWERERWIKQLDAADVCVMSPQIWLNVLANAYWSMDRVSLLVFDEAHHASKRHPYAEIMRNHYHPLKARTGAVALPRILGLTKASPISNVKNPEKALSDLEATLDVLGDVFEALLAAVFIDAGLKLDPVWTVLDELYKEVMPLLSETEHRVRCFPAFLSL